MMTENIFHPNLSIIYTIGHSNSPAEKIIEFLKNYNIQILVDVRSSPFSRYCPQFNRETFGETLQKARIEYLHAGDYLGGKPKDPTCYIGGKLPDKKTDILHLVDFPAIMKKDFFQQGIHLLLSIAEKKRVVLMCSEEDPAKCHRHHLIGRYLTRQGLTVVHIRGDGNLVEDQKLPVLPEESFSEQINLF